MSYKKMIPKCFGAVDKKFALHAIEADHAFELLTELRRQGIEWEQIEAELRQFLHGTLPSHTEEQIKIAKKMFKPWLS